MKLFLCLYCIICITTVSYSNSKQPNIVLIMADDLGYGSLSCYGSKWVKTPHIDQLANNGVRFTDFHSNGPMCTPTRAALLTGRYQQRCKWVDDSELSPVFQKQRKANMKQRWAWGMSLNELTLAEVLKEHGYATALFGKWHLGYDFKFHPQNQGFDIFRGFIAGAVDYHTHVSVSGLKQLDWWNGEEIQNENGYATDLLTKYATEFIQQNSKKPFFLYLTHGAPHSPYQGRTPNDKKSKKKQYIEMIEVLDESVGTIVKTLKDHNLTDNTIIIFCSDNGGVGMSGVSTNGQYRGNKGSVFEGGHRVPFIMSMPGIIPTGFNNSSPTMSIDIFPTIIEMTKITLPTEHTLDGQSLWGKLEKGHHDTNRNLHWLFGEKWAMRQGDWKLVGSHDKITFLSNLKDDPEEKENFLQSHPEKAKALHDLHLKWIQDVGKL